MLQGAEESTSPAHRLQLKGRDDSQTSNSKERREYSKKAYAFITISSLNHCLAVAVQPVVEDGTKDFPAVLKADGEAAPLMFVRPS